MRSIDVFIDESGNLGYGAGRYFTIAFVVVDIAKTKTIRRRMKKASLFMKQKHINKVWKDGEVKAAYLNPEDKQIVLQSLCKPDIQVYSITTDKEKIHHQWLDDKAAFYNFMSKYVIDAIVRDNPDVRQLNCYLDARTIQVQSKNSFEDYLKIHLVYENNMYDIEFNGMYIESHLDYGIQTADFVANAINQYYLSGKNNLITYVEPSLKNHQILPADQFGQ